MTHIKNSLEVIKNKRAMAGSGADKPTTLQLQFQMSLTLTTQPHKWLFPLQQANTFILFLNTMK